MKSKPIKRIFRPKLTKLTAYLGSRFLRWSSMRIFEWFFFDMVWFKASILCLLLKKKISIEVVAANDDARGFLPWKVMYPNQYNHSWTFENLIFHQISKLQIFVGNLENFLVPLLVQAFERPILIFQLQKFLANDQNQQELSQSHCQQIHS